MCSYYYCYIVINTLIEYKSVGERIANEAKKLPLFIDWLITTVLKYNTDVIVLHAICGPLIKNINYLPVLEEKLIKKSRSDVEGCSLLLALTGYLANKHKLNTVRAWIASIIVF